MEGGHGSMGVDAMEVDRLVRSLRTGPFRLVGSTRWFEQHRVWERLNYQSHLAAQSNTDDFVLSALITEDALKLAVAEALQVELWREQVLTNTALQDAILCDTASGPMRLYFILFHEATVLNLLESALYHDYAAEALGDSLLDLVDYCVRNVTSLIAFTHAARSLPPPTSVPAQEVRAARHPAGHTFWSQAWDGEDDGSTPTTGAGGSEGGAKAEVPPRRAAARQIRGWMWDMSFARGVASVTILRYLSDHVAKVPLSVMTRLLDTHDLPLLVVPLIENPPWVRKLTASSGVVWQKYVDRAWQDVPPDALLKLTAMEGQPWLTLYNLLMEPACRKRYALHSHRKGTLLRVRKFLNEVLVDQLPLLADVQRYLDEMSLAAVPEATEAGKGGFLLEAVAELQDTLTREALTRPAAPSPSAQLASGGGGSMLMVVGGGGHGTLADRGDADRWTWEEVAGWIATHIFPPSLARGSADGEAPLVSLADLNAMATAYHDDAWLDAVLGSPRCSACGAPATKRCSRCKNVWYCSRECQVGDWKAHKVVCDVVASGAHDGGSKGGGATPSGGAATATEARTVVVPPTRTLVKVVDDGDRT